MAGIFVEISETEIDEMIEILTFVDSPLLDKLVDQIVSAVVRKVNRE